MDAVLVDGKAIGEEALRNFVAEIEKLTGATVEIIPQWVVWSENAAVMTALDCLFGATAEPRVKKPKGKKQKLQPGAQLEAGETHEIKSWEVHIPGISGKTATLPEKITISEKNLRLQSGLFPTGALLRHPKAGWQKVTGELGTGQGMESLDAQEAIAILDA